MQKRKANMRYICSENAMCFFLSWLQICKEKTQNCRYRQFLWSVHQSVTLQSQSPSVSQSLFTAEINFMKDSASYSFIKWSHSYCTVFQKSAFQATLNTMARKALLFCALAALATSHAVSRIYRSHLMKCTDLTETVMSMSFFFKYTILDSRVARDVRYVQKKSE